MPIFSQLTFVLLKENDNGISAEKQKSVKADTFPKFCFPICSI